MEYFLLSIIILVFGAILTLFVKENFKLKIGTIFSAVAFICATIPSINVLLTGQAISSNWYNSAIWGATNLVIDNLSAIFILTIVFSGFLGLLYSNGYLKSYLNKSYPTSSHVLFLMILFASMLMVPVIQNGLLFLFTWEIMSISSFFLVIFEGENKAVLKSGIKYLIYMHLSIIFLLIMVAILTNATNSFNFTDYMAVLKANKHLANLIFVLGFIGFGIKAGFVPFHNWLPDAHPSAPTHVSGIMSGIMIKTGIYGILRLLLMIETPSLGISYFVLLIAGITALYGILYAVTQQDMKKLLAYSSIENIGIIGIGIAIGMIGINYSNLFVTLLGFTGAICHMINHSLFKELLFFAVGNIYQKTHTRDIELLGGISKKMPITATLFIIGAVAICGFPVLNGFISEFLIYAGMFLALPNTNITTFILVILSIGALAMVGTMAILTFTKLTGISLLGVPRSDKVQNINSDSEFIMLFPMSLLALTSLFIGLFPQIFVRIVFCPAGLFAKFVPIKDIYSALNVVIDLLKTLSLLIFVFVAIFIVIMIMKKIISRKSEKYTTWGCGYNKSNSSIQYTASSFVNPFVSTLKPLFKRVSHIKKPKDLFPKDAYYEQEIEDIEEAYIVNPIIKWDEKMLAKFERIQNGNIQQYILFGLIFLILSIVGFIIWG